MSRPPAADRARRVMAMIPWVVAQGGATVEEIAEQFDVSPAVVERDLEQASCYQAGANGWMVAVGDDLIVPVGNSNPPQLLAYRLPR